MNTLIVWLHPAAVHACFLYLGKLAKVLCEAIAWRTCSSRWGVACLGGFRSDSDKAWALRHAIDFALAAPSEKHSSSGASRRRTDDDLMVALPYSGLSHALSHARVRANFSSGQWHCYFVRTRFCHSSHHTLVFIYTEGAPAGSEATRFPEP